MADRYPLVVASSTVQEIALGDNLNLAGSGVTGATSIGATDLYVSNAGIVSTSLGIGSFSNGYVGVATLPGGSGGLLHLNNRDANAEIHLTREGDYTAHFKVEVGASVANSNVFKLVDVNAGVGTTSGVRISIAATGPGAGSLSNTYEPGGDFWLGIGTDVSAGAGTTRSQGQQVFVYGTYDNTRISLIGIGTELRTSGASSKSQIDFYSGGYGGVGIASTSYGYIGLLYNSPGNQLLRIGTNGNSGVTYGLQFDGNNDATFSQDLSITGALSKGSGSFRIPHPIVDGKDLVHSFVEGPRADLIYRGTATLSGGSATVNLDTESGLTAGTWEALCRDPQVWVTSNDGWTLCRGSVSGAILTITAQDSSATDSVNWLVVAERQDDVIKTSNLTDSDGRIIVEPDSKQVPGDLTGGQGPDFE